MIKMKMKRKPRRPCDLLDRIFVPNKYKNQHQQQLRLGQSFRRRRKKTPKTTKNQNNNNEIFNRHDDACAHVIIFPFLSFYSFTFFSYLFHKMYTYCEFWWELICMQWLRNQSICLQIVRTILWKCIFWCCVWLLLLLLVAFIYYFVVFHESQRKASSKPAPIKEHTQNWTDFKLLLFCFFFRFVIRAMTYLFINYGMRCKLCKLLWDDHTKKFLSGILIKIMTTINQSKMIEVKSQTGLK